ncbi:hypothetical protein [Polyangium sp. 6x1]|uniref:hypothetical protein n=1 Tax=Polyangium sp. 6x1 TaxID=3042689 RepID=UPI0024828483|nr:hypothetical protein [Polyangium sp. 6x1]MDI1451684.1 hypothetical protein [Polyangium sp. 6x1]
MRPASELRGIIDLLPGLVWILNLMLNAAEALKDVPPERRRLMICPFVARRSSGSFVHLAVEVPA